MQDAQNRLHKRIKTLIKLPDDTYASKTKRMNYITKGCTDVYQHNFPDSEQSCNDT